MRHWSVLLCLALLVGIIAAATDVAAAAPSTQATVFGTVIDQQNALPIKGAVVELLQDGKVIASATTDAYGNFSAEHLNGGTYVVRIRAKGYANSQTLNVSIAAGETQEVDAALIASANSGGPRTLGRVTVTGQALSSATAIRQTVNVQNIQQVGQVRFTNQLENLPALNVSTSSSPGDDVSVDIRGFGSSETGVLLDDRPVGPFGVGAPDTYNFANSPVSSLDSVDVTYGSGAQGLYGSDTIAGAVNMRLLNPTSTPQYSFQQQLGGFGLSSTAASFSGSYGKIGYLAEAGVAGQTGALNSQIFQSGRPANLQIGAVNPPYVCSNASGTDVSACNQGAETYAVSQANKITTELAKLRYSFSGATTLSISGYSAVQWADSTGNGDNDYLPYATRLGQIELNAPTCKTQVGLTNPDGYVVTTNPVTNASGCYTAQQWAAASSGPVGGGAGRQRSTLMQDYDARFTTKLGINNISLDSYVNNYIFWKDSSLSGGLDASGQKLGIPVFADYYFTHGYLVSDDIATLNNDLSFGWALLNQEQSGNTLTPVGATPSMENIYAFQPNFNTALYRVGNYYIRDSHQFGDHFYAVVNAWFKGSNVTDKNTFDPRVSLQYRPDSSDVVRLTYGRSDGIPAPLLKSTAPVVAVAGASLTSVSCLPASNSIASAGNPDLISESANDYELGFGHRFSGDSNIQVNAYVTSVYNELFNATEPLLEYGLSNVIFGSGTLDLYRSRLISQGCLPPGTTDNTLTYPFLGVSNTYNAANELARGIELNGRGRLTPWMYIDYGYSIESSQQFNIPDTILSNNVTLINGTQQAGIPLHQATLSLDVQPAGFEFRLDNYYVDGNNPFDRPAYIHSNFFVTHPLEHGKLLLTLGGTNIFNTAVQNFGLIGSGVPVATNSFTSSACGCNPVFTGLGQNLQGINTNEQFGLQPAQLVFTLTAHI
jgi:outer membrane receptor protein involved in Fe transport